MKTIFLLFFFSPGRQCSAAVLLKLLYPHGEVCVIPGARERKISTAFLSAEFEKL